MKNESPQQNPAVEAGGSSPAYHAFSTSQQTNRTSTLQFQEIPIGQFFEFRGRRYRKLALSMASNEDRIGTIFQAQTEVLPDLVTSPADRVGLRTATALVDSVGYAPRWG